MGEDRTLVARTENSQLNKRGLRDPIVRSVAEVFGIQFRLYVIIGDDATPANQRSAITGPGHDSCPTRNLNHSKICAPPL